MNGRFLLCEIFLQGSNGSMRALLFAPEGQRSVAVGVSPRKRKGKIPVGRVAAAEAVPIAPSPLRGFHDIGLRPPRAGAHGYIPCAAPRRFVKTRASVSNLLARANSPCR